VAVDADARMDVAVMAATMDDMLATIDARIAELQEARAVIVRVFGSGGGRPTPRSHGR